MSFGWIEWSEVERNDDLWVMYYLFLSYELVIVCVFLEVCLFYVIFLLYYCKDLIVIVSKYDM